jgi:Helix-turn-helix domain
MPEKQILTLTEAAAYLGKTPQLLHYYAKQGRIPSVIIGRKMHYELEAIKGWKPLHQPLGNPNWTERKKKADRS